jgi:hypothetical protein
MFILIPLQFNFYIIKKTDLYYFTTYSLYYNYLIRVNSTQLLISNVYNLIYVVVYSTSDYIKFFFEYFARLVEQKTIFKIVFKRKGGWIHIRNMWPYYLSLRFGYSHPVRYKYNQLSYKRHKKHLAYHILLITGLDFISLYDYSLHLRNVRLFNSYTRRGIRYACQKVIYRKGKESQYTKLKSKIF